MLSRAHFCMANATYKRDITQHFAQSTSSTKQFVLKSFAESNKRTEYVKYAKVFPLTALFGIKVPSKWYRRTVGILEVVCGLAMALIPYHKVKNAANITLLLLMLLGVYQHWMVSDPFERSGPALVFTFMLGGRLVVWYQTSRKEAEIGATAQPQTNGVIQD